MKNSIKFSTALIKNHKWNSIFFQYWKKTTLIIMIPFIILLSIVYPYYITTVNREIKQTLNESFSKISTQFNNIFDDIQRNYILFSIDKNVTTFITSNNISQNGLKTSIYTDRITELMNNLINSYSYFDSVYIYSTSNNYVISSKNSNYIDSFYNKEIFDPYLKDGRTAYMINSKFNLSEKSQNNLSICYSINNGANTQAIIAFNIDLDKLNNVMNLDNNNEIVYLSNSDRRILFSSKLSSIGEYLEHAATKNTDKIYEKTQNNIYFSSQLTSTDLFITSSFNSSVYNNNMVIVNSILLLAFLLVMLLPIIISFYISTQFYSSILEIVSNLESTSEDISEQNNSNELYFINKNILSILNNKKNMEKELVEKIAYLKKLQSITLQTQINPHFIFNTLNLVNAIVMNIAKGKNDAEKVISLLSDLLRSVLSTKIYLITIGEELENAMKYLEIQNIKYKNSYEIIWNIDDSLKKYKTVKLILQPILENSFEHGLSFSDDIKGKITITLYSQKNEIFFRISDNGIGIDKEKLAFLKENLIINDIPENEHIGLCNVNQRIKLIFGETYGVFIDEVNDGTTITINFPMLE